MSNVVKQINSYEEFIDFTDQPKAVVEFSRKYGCNPCKQLEPHYASAALRLADKGYAFGNIYLDEIEPKFLDIILDELGIKSTPTIYFYSYGALIREIHQRSGPLLIKEFNSHER